VIFINSEMEIEFHIELSEIPALLKSKVMSDYLSKFAVVGGLFQNHVSEPQVTPTYFSLLGIGNLSTAVVMIALNWTSAILQFGGKLLSLNNLRDKNSLDKIVHSEV